MNRQPGPLLVMLLGFASIFIIIWGIRSSAYIVNTLLLALVITIAVLPIPGKFIKRGMPVWLSLLLTILIVVVVLVVVILTIVLSITRLTAQVPVYMGEINARSEEVASALSAYPNLANFVESLFSPQVTSQVLAMLGSFLIPFIVQMGMVLFIFFFMISASLSMAGRSKEVFEPGSNLIDRINQFTQDIQHYVSVMTLINFLVGLGDAIFLYILGVDFALLWGVLAWFMGYIPTIGFWFALIPPTILAYAQYGLSTAAIVFFGYVLINGSVQNFLQPKMMGDRLNISPLVVFVSLFFWAWVLGGIGALLAVPLTMIVLAVLDNFESTRWLVVLTRIGAAQPEEERKEAFGRLREMWGTVRSRAGMKPRNETK